MRDPGCRPCDAQLVLPRTRDSTLAACRNCTATLCMYCPEVMKSNYKLNEIKSISKAAGCGSQAAPSVYCLYCRRVAKLQQLYVVARLHSQLYCMYSPAGFFTPIWSRRNFGTLHPDGHDHVQCSAQDGQSQGSNPQTMDS